MPSSEVEPLLLTAREAARALAISPRTLWTVTNRGEIRPVRIGRAVRYDVRDLIEWIDEQKRAK
ncbi:MAG: helix-turn-helix domain-containing protein [Planctomycetaceae bacterium]